MKSVVIAISVFICFIYKSPNPIIEIFNQLREGIDAKWFMFILPFLLPVLLIVIVYKRFQIGGSGDGSD